MVTQDGSNYRIGVQDLASGAVRILSKGRLDASPSFAPNGAMIIYAGIEGGHSILQRVSVDGLHLAAPACRHRRSTRAGLGCRLRAGR